MITVTWKSTGCECESFRTVGGLAAWLSTAEYGVTSETNGHASVDLRNVDIPAEEEDAARLMLSHDLYKNGRRQKLV